MKINHLILFLGVAILTLGTGCKSEFERVRTSGDPVLLLEKAHTYFEEEEWLKAQTLYELVIGSYRGKEEAELISFRYAYTYYHLESYILSAYYFKNFSSTFGASGYKEEADFMSAYSNYELSPNFRLDQSYSLKAIESFEEFTNVYPSSERVGQCNRLIDEMRIKLEVKEYESAKLYFDLQQYQAAIRSYENILIEYPETARAELIRFEIINSAYLLAKNSFVEKQQERYESVLSYANKFIRRYDTSSYKEQVEEMLANSQKRLKELQDV